ncbi:DNA recombination protein RmuC [Methylomarinovum caldicuralii]|uniref:DNA recombination protein RmuC n=1 Tax=Methylomarinovum caldicuralii TaxID=438856 RepID=A0AAU9C3I9_9GAMM|nr:DNA recombination protein RmuC [Methylomarinovum caldicuralii]BCX81765.1 DNA recombination protein RmuC [Methylomarinovum caldicuralii]
MPAFDPIWLIPLAAGLLLGALLTALLQQRHLSRREQDLALSDQRNRQLMAELESLRSRLGELEDERERLMTRNTELETRLEDQRRHHEEKLAELQQARTQLKAEFEALAARILEEKGRQFSEQSRHSLDQIMAPMREQLQEFRRRIDAIHSEEQKQHGSLLQELRRLQEANQKLDEEAQRLARALKGDSKAQGTWGEIVLETVLERSGLRQGQEYEVQGSFRDPDGKLLRPDVIVHLPEGKDIVIDSKVSLSAWQEYVNADGDSDRQTALKRHLASIRRHIDQLSTKNYEDLPGLNCLDFVLMFMPIEAAFSAAFQADPELFARAFEKRIIVVTPTTLLATLRTVENLWRFERQQENVQHIIERAGRLYDKLRGFLEDFDKIGQQLQTTQNTYNQARNKLTDGRGNLIRQAEMLVDLGVPVKKRLPDLQPPKAD